MKVEWGKMMGNLKLEVKNNIATITINNPPANVLSSFILDELSVLFHSLEENEDVRVVLICGEGNFFSAGADVKEFIHIETDKANVASSRGQELFERIENYSKPVIAVINGPVLGGGLEFVMSCHMRLASNNATFGLPEINLGIIPGFAGTQRLTRYVGVAKACEMMLTGSLIECDEALRIGLVNHVYDESILYDKAIELATKISSKSRVAVKSILTLAYASKTVSYQRAVARESQLFGEIFSGEDAREGITAFLEKRVPNFS